MLDLRDFQYQRKYSDAYITHLIVNEGYIPVASGAELNALRNSVSQRMGAGTIWDSEYTTGLDQKYIQVRNIDLSAYQTGEGFTYLGELTGIYDGNNLKIKNLWMSSTSSSKYFISLGVGSEFSNVTFEDFYVSAMNTSIVAMIFVNIYGDLENVHFNRGIILSKYRTGCIYISRDKSIRNCSAQNIYSEVSQATGTNSVASAFICLASNATATQGVIENCYSMNNRIIGEFGTGSGGTSSVAGGFGGILSRNTLIQNCYSLNEHITCNGTSTSKYSAPFGLHFGYGGYSPITLNCFASSKPFLSGSGNIGGLYASNSGGGIITNSYYDSEVSGQSDTGKGLPRTTAQMVNGTANSFILPNGNIDPDSLSANAMYTNWDENIWKFHNNKYPKIKRI